MVDHFHEQVVAKNKIGGAARAMVVTNGIERAIQYFHAIRDYLQQRKSQYRAVVAFSGEPEFGGQKVTEASLNGFPSGQIVQRIQKDLATLLGEKERAHYLELRDASTAMAHFVDHEAVILGPRECLHAARIGEADRRGTPTLGFRSACTRTTPGPYFAKQATRRSTYGLSRVPRRTLSSSMAP